MITEIICSYSIFACEAIKYLRTFNLPSIILYSILILLVIFFCLLGIISFFADISPKFEIFKAKICLPLAKKWKNKQLSKQAIKADIKGNVNLAVSKFTSELPPGWLIPMEFQWVQYESKDDFLNENEVVIRLRPVESQDANFVNAVYCFLRKSFFPRTKKVIPEVYREASVLFASNRIIESQKPELINLFNESIFESEIDKDNKILDVFDRYKKMDGRGFFSGTFLREVHSVASDVKLSPLRNKMREETNNIIKHIEEFIKLYDEGSKGEKKQGTIPEDKWHRLGPITKYGFLLIARPSIASKYAKGIQTFVHRAKKDALEGVERLYAFGSNNEKEFAEQVINAISKQIPEYKLVEKFSLSNDYRGEKGGVGALFTKNDKSVKIYFVAHSTTKDNEAEIASGWKDVELSDLGVQQSKELGERFKDIKIDLICCSDLKRAVDTVRIAFGNRIPIIIDKRLRELNYGDFNGEPSKTVSSMKDKAIKEPFPNGESYDQAMIRLHEFYTELKKKHPNKTILVVGHRATQYGLDTLVGGKTIEQCLSIPFKWQSFWEYNL
ncbi:MAG: histidine phosphatase family protein [Candidatus Staskawiczbacteria bacterium]|jgi:broad specificity phosphatase PhoE